MGSLKGMFVRYLNQSVVVLSWHDLRDAKKAHSLITTNILFDMDEPLSVAFISPLNLIKVGPFSIFFSSLIPFLVHWEVTFRKPKRRQYYDHCRAAIRNGYGWWKTLHGR